MSPWVPQDNGSPKVVVGPKAENHHWWPKGISRFWKGQDGKVGAIRVEDDGSIREYRPDHKKLGGQRDGHSHILTENRDDSPWNRSEEDAFDNVDSSMGQLVSRLQTMATQAVQNPTHVWRTAKGDPYLSDALAPAMASLCLRSPRSRLMASGLGRTLMGYERGSLVDRGVSLSNMLTSFYAHEKGLRCRGRFGIFVAKKGEFIYGDGCFHNIPASNSIVSNVSMLVPMTPTIAVGYRLPLSYMTEPMFCTMAVDEEMVGRFNELVQIYSERQLFFANDKPELSPFFIRGEFGQVSSQDNWALYWLNQLPGLDTHRGRLF